MIYIRQLLIKCKHASDLELLHAEIRHLAQIDYIQRFTIMECISSEKYAYIEDLYDFSVMFYFSSYSDIEKYCAHPIHVEFVKNLLEKVEIAIFDFSSNS